MLLNIKKLQTPSIKLRTLMRWPISLLSRNIIVKVLANAIRKEKRKKKKGEGGMRERREREKSEKDQNIYREK